MKRYHCWYPRGEPDNGRGFDADTPEHAAEAYVQWRGDVEGEGVRLVRVRLPGEVAISVRVKCRLVLECKGETIEPREEP